MRHASDEFGCLAMNGFRPVIEWLIDGAPSDAHSEDVLATLCPRLVRAACRCGGPRCSSPRCIAM
jgi:hypothetical protein